MRNRTERSWQELWGAPRALEQSSSVHFRLRDRVRGFRCPWPVRVGPMISLHQALLLDCRTLLTAPAVREPTAVALGVDQAIDFFAAHAHASDQALRCTVPISDFGATVRVEPVKMSGVFHSERLSRKKTRTICAAGHSVSGKVRESTNVASPPGSVSGQEGTPCQPGASESACR